MIRELDQRNSSGDIVTLRWNPVTDVVSLTVHRDLDDGCELVTADIPSIPHDCAMDAFKHPYAYAGHIGSISLPDRTSTYATTEDDYPESECDGLDDDEPGGSLCDAEPFPNNSPSGAYESEV